MPRPLIALKSVRPLGSTVILGASMWALACTPARQVVVVAPPMDAEQEALRLEDHTKLVEPLRIVFDWELNEQGTRVSGRGVARIEPPYRARLDLFHGSGETVITAALVNGELILPPEAPDDILPPPDLMWGVLGVFRPEFGTELLAAEELADGQTRLRYRYDDGRELHYVVSEGILTTIELVESGSVVQRVVVDQGEDSRYPREAIYRNMADFRELKITRDVLVRVEPFPSDIWNPIGGEGR